jgi:hypothetical protein
MLGLEVYHGGGSATIGPEVNVVRRPQLCQRLHPFFNAKILRFWIQEHTYKDKSRQEDTE